VSFLESRATLTVLELVVSPRITLHLQNARTLVEIV
jgi:hypothetical protein